MNGSLGHKDYGRSTSFNWTYYKIQGQEHSASIHFLSRNLDRFGSIFISLRADSSEEGPFEALEINICKLEVENGVAIDIRVWQALNTSYIILVS